MYHGENVERAVRARTPDIPPSPPHGTIGPFPPRVQDNNTTHNRLS